MEWSLGTSLHTLAAGDEVGGKLSVKAIAEVICNGRVGKGRE